MAYYGVGDLCLISGKIASVEYVNVLKKYVHASRGRYDMEATEFIFQQSFAGKNSKVLPNKHKIAVTEWPSNSLDLNPFETIWVYIKNCLYQYSEEPKTVNELRPEWKIYGPQPQWKTQKTYMIVCPGA
ncbi:hypothetical protein BGZ46_000745 [Entomortierella lignicola]|nr:hypothetical protein BGZ46_000745 [Entomortierella lignicola]